jgi:hypothetical protein
METLKNIFWVILIFFTPLMILVFGVINFVRKEKLSEILLNSLIALFFYLLSTGSFILIIMIIFFSSLTGDSTSDEINHKSIGVSDLVALISVLGYVGFGLYICWFVKPKTLINS